MKYKSIPFIFMGLASLVGLVLTPQLNAKSFSDSARYQICTIKSQGCQDFIVDAVNNARHSVVYPSAWLSSAALTKAILAAKKRGVVTEMLSPQSTDPYSQYNQHDYQSEQNNQDNQENQDNQYNQNNYSHNGNSRSYGQENRQNTADTRGSNNSYHSTASQANTSQANSSYKKSRKRPRTYKRKNVKKKAHHISVIDREKVFFAYTVTADRDDGLKFFSVYSIHDPGFASHVVEQELGKYRLKKFDKKRDGVCRMVIPQRYNGNYEVYGSINGREVNFLVDTGATYVTVPSFMAKELKLKPRIKSKAQTATQRIEAHLTWIDELKVGPITLHNVKTALLPKSNNHKILLGMSALRQLDLLQHKGNLILLQYRKHRSNAPCVVDANTMLQ